MNEWLEFLTILMILGCIIWWVVIWIRMWVYRGTGKCPKSRICKDSICKNAAWCRKYERYADVFMHNYESMKEAKRKAGKKSSDNCRRKKR